MADLAGRLLPLAGGFNFRDFGGYATLDGRQVKWRRLYRSGSLARLTAADGAELDARGIGAVIDLRTITEQQTEPSHWAQRSGIAYWARNHQETFGNVHHMLDGGIATAAQARQAMIDGFRLLPRQQGAGFAELLRRIAVGQVPLVVHCTAGKDRTGGAAAVVLALLGVSRAIIAEDFQLTEQAVDLAAAFRDPAHPEIARYAALGEDVTTVLASAPPDFILTMLDAIDADYGSVEGYARDLGVTDADIAAIRAQLLE